MHYDQITLTKRQPRSTAHACHGLYDIGSVIVHKLPVAAQRLFFALKCIFARKKFATIA